MRLQPASRGVQMLGDSVPHVLSLIQALLPGGAGRIERLRFSGGGPASDRLDLGFRFCSGDRELGVEIELRRSDRHPRAGRASKSMDGAPSVWSPPTDTGYPSPPTAARCRCPIR